MFSKALGKFARLVGFGKDAVRDLPSRMDPGKVNDDWWLELHRKASPRNPNHRNFATLDFDSVQADAFLLSIEFPFRATEVKSGEEGAGGFAPNEELADFLAWTKAIEDIESTEVELKALESTRMDLDSAVEVMWRKIEAERQDVIGGILGRMDPSIRFDDALQNRIYPLMQTLPLPAAPGEENASLISDGKSEEASERIAILFRKLFLFAIKREDIEAWLSKHAPASSLSSANRAERKAFLNKKLEGLLRKAQTLLTRKGRIVDGKDLHLSAYFAARYCNKKSCLPCDHVGRQVEDSEVLAALVALDIRNAEAGAKDLFIPNAEALKEVA